MTKQLRPVNGHLVIEPLKHDGFMATQRETYEEIGIVTASSDNQVPDGSKVYFDSWLAAKYPKLDTEEGEFYWLVKWSDVRAVEVVG